MTEISIILYVYNCETFLKDSLNSLLNQSFHDFEVLCIDDESDDNSLEILNKYSKKDGRIKVFPMDHLGFSKALNKTINLVEGNYIYFMKPSSYLKVDALNILFNHAKKTNADLIFTDTNYQYNNIYYDKSDSFNQIQYNINKDVFNYKDLFNLIFYFDPSLENKFYNAEFIKYNNLKFFEDLKYPEHLFFYNSLLLAEKISYLNEFLFDYIKPFEFLKREEITIENIYREFDLILKIFDEINELNRYKNNFLELKLSFFLREYSRIREDYKEKFFNIFRNDLINSFLSNEFEDKSIEFLSDFNRKIFEQILISENIYEFDLLRKNLFLTTEFNDIVDRKAFLKSVLFIQ